MMSGKPAHLNVLQEIFIELDHLSKLSEMPRRIELCRRALAVISREIQPELWAVLQDDLAGSLAQNPIGSRAENTEQAIYHFKQALEVRTRQRYPKQWASTLNNLATAYRDRIYGERAENIEQAIKYYNDALQIRTRQTLPKEWAQTQYNLAGANFKRIRGERLENLERAIQSAHWALEVYTRQVFPYYWAQTQNILGEAYRVRIRESRGENIEEAIQHFNQALEIYTRQSFPEDWASVQNNLGNAYLARIHGERAENFERAIHHYKQALELRTRLAYPELWAMTQYNLGDSYRYRIFGDQVENIKQAIYHFQQALEVRTEQSFPEDWAQTQNNLGNVYLAHTRGELSEENIEQAIQHYENALKVHTRQSFPKDWAQAQNNLGYAYMARARGDREENIERAISHFEQALEVRTRQAAPEDWAQTLNNLAGAYAKRIRGEPTDNMEQAIQYFYEVLDVRNREALPASWAEIHNNLAIAYADRKQGERKENIKQAIYHYQQALEVYTPKAFPDHCLKAARALAYLAFEEQRWNLASDAYDIAFQAQEVLLQATFTRTSKQIELSEVQNLPPRAAYAHLKGGNIKRAVEILEEGRAQLLRESLERRRQDLEQLPTLGFKHLLKDYVRAMEAFNSLQNWGTPEKERPGNWMDQMEQAWEKVQAAAAAIRKEAGYSHPQYRYFLQSLPFDGIQKQAQDKSLVYLTATSAGGLALVVSKQGVEAIELPELNQKSLYKKIWSPSDKEIDRINRNLNQGKITLEDIEAVSGGYFSTYALWNLTSYLTNTPRELLTKLSKAWQETLNTTTHWLWEVGMKDLIPMLKKSAESATLIPAGQLALLPLHAAWTEDASKPTSRRYAVDELNISYAPSAHSLLQASSVAKRPTERLMAVDNPDRSLHFAEYEVQAALDMFKHSKHLHGSEATFEAVKREMQSAQILHFATHGRAGWEREEQAQLKLADRDLTLPDIFELNLNQTRLAVLSACETGVPRLKLIDEMVGMPTGMMQAGVPGVVGSLWSVNDKSTALLMARFYSLWRKDGHTPQEALRQAQIWLRDSTTAQKMDLFEETGHLSADIAQTFYERIAWDEPDERVFESPYFWAAFTYIGV